MFLTSMLKVLFPSLKHGCPANPSPRALPSTPASAREALSPCSLLAAHGVIISHRTSSLPTDWTTLGRGPAASCIRCPGMGVWREWEAARTSGQSATCVQAAVHWPSRLRTEIGPRHPPCCRSPHSRPSAQTASSPSPDPIPSAKKDTLFFPLCTKMYFCDIPKYRHLPRPQVVKQRDVNSAQGLGREGRGRCGLSATFRKRRAATPSRGWQGQTVGGRRPGAFPPGLLIQPVLPRGRNARRIQEQAQGRRKEKRSSP